MGGVRMPYVLRHKFVFLKLEACYHPCSKGGISTFGPFRPTYCQLQVKSWRVDLLHLMCRSHVQSAPPPRASTQRYVGFYDQKLPQTPPPHLGSSSKHPAAARGGPAWSKVKMSQNILRLRLGGYFAHAL